MRQEQEHQSYRGMQPSLLKIHKVSHTIKKSSSSSSSSSSSVSSLTTNNNEQNHHQQRGPIIIYTHSPKVIHTNPRDFMALVQKLTGMTRSEIQDLNPNSENIGNSASNITNGHNNTKIMMKISNLGNDNNDTINSNSNNDDNESSLSSVITEENNNNNILSGDLIEQKNPCMGGHIYESSNVLSEAPLVPRLPFIMSNSTDVLIDNGDPLVYDSIDNNFPYYSQIT